MYILYTIFFINKLKNYDTFYRSTLNLRIILLLQHLKKNNFASILNKIIFKILDDYNI